MELTALEKRLGMTFPEDQLTDILYHASFQPQDSELLKRNKEYIHWGRSIVNALYAVFLYQEQGERVPAQLTAKIKVAPNLIEKEIYKKFNLEEFVIKSNGEMAASHMDIASKLVVLIYQTYDLIKVYHFLSPFFPLVDMGTDEDYKTLIQEYAQSIKKSPKYEVIDVTGPDHQKVYTCKLSIGDRFTIADAIGKRKAQKEVSKKFAIKYGIRANGVSSEKKRKEYHRNIDRQRASDLEKIMKKYQLNRSLISLRQMDEAMIHSSFANEHRNQGCYHNSAISVVGASVIDMLTIEYIFGNYNISRVSVLQEKGLLVKDDNIARSIPDECLKYLLRSTHDDNKRTNIRLKIEILKSIFGFLLVNYITGKNKATAGFTKDLAGRVLNISNTDKILYYRGFLQEVTQKYGWSTDIETKLLQSFADNSNTYVSSVTVHGSDWTEFGEGAGESKVKATNMASKDILQKLLEHCESEEIKEAILRMLDPELLFLHVNHSKSNREETIKQNDVATPHKEPPIPKPVKIEYPKEVVFDDPQHVLYICKGTISCRKKRHDIVSVTGLLGALTGKTVKINTNFCKTCNTYFISLSEYKYYQNLHGVLLGNIQIQEDGYSSGNGYENLAKESVLHICGYTVNQATGLSSDQRRRILGNLMDHDVISKYRIIEYLQFFINNSRYRYNMRLANQKWSDDLKWIRNYNIDKQRKYVIVSEKKWR